MKFRQSSYKRLAQLSVALLIIFLYSFFRLKTIYFNNVAFTYDQGRDFLKAAEIVLNRDITFIGPTTGLQGIFHGAWWYYILTFPFILTKGVPIGFYYFNFAVQFISFLVFYYFAKKYFGFVTASILAFLISTSGYFMFTSVFLGNNVMAMPAFLVLLLCSLLLLQKKYTISFSFKKYVFPFSAPFFAGIALGFVSEFEFAFGLMLIPVYMLLMAVFQVVSKPFKSIKHVLFFIAGLALPFIPRLMFELKNGFPQTQTLINFIVSPSYYTPKPYDAIFRDRVEIFRGFFDATFMSDTVKILVMLTGAAFILYRVYIRKVSIHSSFWFVASIVALLFGISTLYKDTFWSYYYEGIPYAFLLIGGYIFTMEEKQQHVLLNVTKTLLLSILLILGIGKFINEWRQPMVYDGIKVHQDIVSYILTTEKDPTNYCVKVYTPPVIPHTYDYIFLYNELHNNVSRPSPDFQRDECWFILEKDDYVERKQKWIDQNIPKDYSLMQSKRIKDVDIQLWHK